MRLQSSGPRTCLVGLVPSISVKGSMRLQGSLGGCDEFAPFFSFSGSYFLVYRISSDPSQGPNKSWIEPYTQHPKS